MSGHACTEILDTAAKVPSWFPTFAISAYFKFGGGVGGGGGTPPCGLYRYVRSVRIWFIPGIFSAVLVISRLSTLSLLE